MAERQEDHITDQVSPEAVDDNLFRLIVERNADAILLVDARGLIRYLNPAAEDLLGGSAETMLGTHFGFPLRASDIRELDVVHPDTGTRIVEMRVAETVLGDETVFVASLRDITPHVFTREALRAISLEDDLTGLYNRRALVVLAEQQLRLAERNARGTVLLYIDVDGLKEINDTFGHQEGDQTLIDVARILRLTFRSSDIIARIGGDEFAVLAPEAKEENGEDLRRRLLDAVDGWNASGDGRALSVSVGVARYEQGSAVDVEALLNAADADMYARRRHARVG